MKRQTKLWQILFGSTEVAGIFRWYALHKSILDPSYCLVFQYSYGWIVHSQCVLCLFNWCIGSNIFHIRDKRIWIFKIPSMLKCCPNMKFKQKRPIAVVSLVFRPVCISIIPKLAHKMCCAVWNVHLLNVQHGFSISIGRIEYFNLWLWFR